MKPISTYDARVHVVECIYVCYKSVYIRDTTLRECGYDDGHRETDDLRRIQNRVTKAA